MIERYGEFDAVHPDQGSNVLDAARGIESAKGGTMVALRYFPECTRMGNCDDGCEGDRRVQLFTARSKDRRRGHRDVQDGVRCPLAPDADNTAATKKREVTGMQPRVLTVIWTPELELCYGVRAQY